MPIETEVAEFLADYYAAFSTLDVTQISRFFNEPAMFMGAPGAFAVPDSTAVATIVGPVLGDLRKRDFERSELILRSVNALGDIAAVAIGVAIRFRTGGEELERVGVTYVVHKSEAGWKIAVMVLHHP